MSRPRSRDAEEVRNQFSDLLTAAEKGDPTIITRYGRPVAALVPILSEREFEVVRLLILGHTQKEIAEILHLSVKTVSTYLKRILQKSHANAPSVAHRQQSILGLKGTGRGLWGKNSSETIRKLRDEWDR